MSKSTILNFILILFCVSVCVIVKCQQITFPDGSQSRGSQSRSRGQNTNDRNQLEDIDSLLIQTGYITNVSDFLHIFGASIPQDPTSFISARRRSNYAQQAGCEPETRTVELNTTEAGALFFPKCVRVKRCGGCCGLSPSLQCMPTRISHQEVRRARLRVRRSANQARPNASADVIQVFFIPFSINFPS